MWTSFFKDLKPNPIKLIQDILNIVRDILVLVSDFYSHSLLDFLINLMPSPRDYSKDKETQEMPSM